MTNCSLIVVEAESRLRQRIVEGLALDGISVASTATPLEFYRTLAGRRFDVAVVDLELPDQAGYEIVHHLHQNVGIGIVVLMADNDPLGRIRGYQAGADLCFAKPVDVKELGVVACNLAGRVRTKGEPPGEQAWRYDPIYWNLRAPGGIAVRLTPKEKTLMDNLLATPGVTVTRDRVLSALEYGVDAHGNRNLDTLVRRLRRKVEETAGQELPVQTVHAVGYVFTAPVSAA